jgi:predicted transposase/invertase (TIGR01784 family)
MSTYDMILEKGFEKGIEKGIEQGIEKGIEQGIEKSIINAFDNKYKLTELKQIFGLSEEKIIEILKANNRL